MPDGSGSGSVEGDGASGAAGARPPPESPREATVASDTDLDGFRAVARRLLADGIAPHRVHWRVAERGDGELALAHSDADRPPSAPPGETPPVQSPSGSADAPSQTPPPVVRVPPDFVALCADVILHADPQRFGLLYRLFWRLVHEPALRHDPLDADMTQARQMAQQVRRDIHKMRAFVRFRQVPPPAGDAALGEPLLHVAWFEPQHHIVERNAPFFARRFTGMRWAILTPERCVRWDGEQLHFSRGADRADAPPADAGEALWLTYYESIFNPARLKLRAMEKEMPRAYWHNLPEAALIAPLAAQAHQRRAGMIEQEPSLPQRRIVPIHRPSSDAASSADADADANPSAGPVHDLDSDATPLVGSSAGDDVLPGHPAATEHDAAARWQQLRRRAAGCRECPLGEPATQTVWGEGPLGAALMLVGEQPGDKEDLEGRPFVGPSGQLLARALAVLGLERRQLYVTNAVKHFKYEPRGKRRIHKTPAQREADACAHWLEDEITSVAPGALVALGATAARQLMGRAVAVMRERGQWLTRADGRRVLVTLHPSALLRGEPAEMEAAFAAWVEDLRRALSPPG